MLWDWDVIAAGSSPLDLDLDPAAGGQAQR
jgi:hypothetical protein